MTVSFAERGGTPLLYCKSKRKASMGKKAHLLWVVLFVIIFFSQASAEITPPEDDINVVVFNKG